ncbi:MAG: cyclophilin-like fold protein [Candidatus Latescibacterota bacterium]
MRIEISWESGRLTAILNDTPTARLVWEALPHTASASTWGEEVYFELPVRAELEDDARQVVDPGTVCFWTGGNSLALPYGPTPASQGDECRLVTEVNVIGSIEGDPRALSSVRDGIAIRVARAE